jgi:hypothetical protein
MIRIELSDETEARLRERAAAEGKDPADLALQAVEEKLASGNGSSGQGSSETRAGAWTRFTASMHDWTRCLPAKHEVDDSRESIYEGRGE